MVILSESGLNLEKKCPNTGITTKIDEDMSKHGNND